MNRIALLAAAAAIALPAAAFAQAGGGADQRPGTNADAFQHMPSSAMNENQNDRHLNTDESAGQPGNPQVGALPPGTDAEHGSSQDAAQPDRNGKGEMME